jgi:ATP-dependent DNA helicase RecG
LIRAVDLWRALALPLRFAAKDSFRHLDEIRELGATLMHAAEALATAPELAAARAELGRYAQALAGFDAAERGERARLVALGLRLCATHAPSAPAPVEPGSPLTTLHGVGPTTAERLAERGLESFEDLLLFLPLEYQDRRGCVPLAALEGIQDGTPVTVRGVVLRAWSRRRFGRRPGMVEVTLGESEDGPPLLACVWFRAHGGMAARFEPGQGVVASGVLRRYQKRPQLAHPDVQLDDGDATARVRRRYREVEGVAPRRLERICSLCAREHADAVEDAVPASVAAARGLPSQASALRLLHFADGEPPDAELDLLVAGTHPAQARLAFDELFSLQLAVARRRAGWERHRAIPCRIEADERARLEGCFPFPLTAAQRRVIDELHAALAEDHPMHRLLQGDVGSGKTAVAFAAVYAAMACGLQAAVMAPTEILARQHLSTMAPWCDRLGKRAALLTGETPRAVRESLLALADAGAVQLLIGTHALLSRQLSLPDLGLVVIDEQHRFGVVQRARLRDRESDRPLPHLLVMTATPIPRSLALTLYGDLDLSILDELPPGRQPPRTRLFLGRQRPRAEQAIRKALEAGEQVFVVCPLVEESEKLDAADAVSTAARLAREHPEHRVGLVHGRMPPRERDAAMAAFRARELDLLVATTVIEVGVDVPAATMMVVEHADRFGLAQLHQLRGRVGRGGGQAHCLLLSNVAAETPAGQRLAALARSHDGFAIAEADLELRGPGEIFGTRQSGVPRLRFADLRRHAELLAEARAAALGVLSVDPELAREEHRVARSAMERRWERLPLLGAEAG